MGCISKGAGLLALASVLAACGGSGGSGDDATIVVGAAAPAAPVPAASAPSAPVLTVAITARGSALGPIAAATLSAAGGTIASVDGRLTLTVPAGALAAAQSISIQTTSNESPNGSGLAYRLLPDGLVFSSAVRLTVRYDDADIAGSDPQALMLAFQDAQGRWQPLADPVLDAAAKTVSAETLHFTEYALYTGFRLKPPVATLGVGKAMAISMDICFPKDDNGVTVIACKVNYVDSFKWAVNGIANGSPQVGMIDAGNLGVRFEAPAVVPAVNPVMVSAELTSTISTQKHLVLASIWIEGHPPLGGTVISTQVSKLGSGTMTHSTFASVDFRFDPTEQMYRPASGNVVSRYDFVDPVAGCDYHVAWSGAIGPQDGYVAIREDDGDTPRYTAAGITLAAHTGTTSCTSSGRVEPLTIDFASARWLPAPPAPHPLVTIPGAMDLRAKSDGTLSELITWTPGTGGTDTTVQWQLKPH